MDYTGERCLIESINEDSIEHFHRYAFASEFVKNKSIIDIASGEGYGSFFLSKYASHVVGIDISEEAVKHAQQKYTRSNLSYMQGSAFQIPIDSHTIDIVVSFETLEHHEKHIEMIKEIKRILQPNGILIMSTPDKYYYTDVPQNINKYHVKELYTHEFQNLINSHFTHTIYLKQKSTFNSIISHIHESEIIEYSGILPEVHKQNGISAGLYDIVIASDFDVPKCNSSIYEGKAVLEYIKYQFERANTKYLQKQEYILSIEKSLAYRLSKLFLYPFSLFK